jgi:hypothetical protein
MRYTIDSTEFVLDIGVNDKIPWPLGDKNDNITMV